MVATQGSPKAAQPRGGHVLAYWSCTNSPLPTKSSPKSPLPRGSGRHTYDPSVKLPWGNQLWGICLLQAERAWGGAGNCPGTAGMELL